MTSHSVFRFFSTAFITLALSGLGCSSNSGGNASLDVTNTHDQRTDLSVDLVDATPTDTSKVDGDSTQAETVDTSCNSHEECPGGYCNPKSHTCVECLITDHCASPLECINWRCQEAGSGCTAEECAEFSMVCEEESGLCVACLLSTDCDEGNYCEDDNKCREWVCEPDSKWCDGTKAVSCNEQGSEILPAQQCDDGQVCTVGDICVDGECGTPQAKNCDDFNVCTDDDCDPDVGCVTEYNDGPCQDGTPCTVGDTCLDGVCQPGERVCECASNAECDDKNDDDLCNGSLHCIDGNCVLNPLSVVTCPAGNDCLWYECEPSSGDCLSHFNDNDDPCDDGNLCSVNDRCLDGQCKGDLGACNDDNICTNDLCDPQDGCSHVFNTVDCDDGDECTGPDKCVEGECTTSPFDCNDGNDCTQDSCDSAEGCQFVPVSGECNDGNECTINDTCTNGVCAGVVEPCDDDNVCTTDTCNPIAGCAFTPNNELCDDNNVCTLGDHCVGGYCVAGAMMFDCNDDNQCTLDSCELDTGECVNTPISGPCNDNDPCTIGDTCQEGQCVPGTPLDCDDNKICTEDYCGNQGTCIHAPTTGPCDDGNECTGGDHCIGGNCIAGNPMNCNDYNICTNDSCDPAVGCVNANNQALCNDYDMCTQVDKCAGGLCVGTAPLDCDDDKICTEDYCDPQLGCQHVAIALDCDDGNACTDGDYCANGQCQSGALLQCDDGNDCTDDYCDPAVGCAVVLNFDDCEDGNPCTSGDKCQEGHCMSGATMNCEDGNPCTEDICNYDSCLHSPIPAECTDNNPCTVNDTCDGGACTGLEVENCGCHSLSLDGVTAYGEVPANSAMNVTVAGTVEGWFKLHAAGEYTLVSRWKGAQRSFKLEMLADGTVKFTLKLSSGNEATIQSQLVPFAGWHHIAASWDESQLRLYFDGSQAAVFGIAYAAASSQAPLTIGFGYSDPEETRERFYNGSIDELRITASTLYSGTSFVPEERLGVVDGTVGCWDANQSEISILFDISDNFLHAPLTGTWFWSADSEAAVCVPVSDYPPSTPVITIQPNAPADNDNILCEIVQPAIDLQNDPIEYTYQWYLDGVLQEDLTGNVVPAARTQPCPLWDCANCQEWTCKVTAVSNSKPGVATSAGRTVGIEDCEDCTGSVYGTHCYELRSGEWDWGQAQTECELWGGHLVTISSSGENDFVQGLVSENTWLGLSDIANPDTFVWLTGEPLTYTNWANQQPDDGGLFGDGEDCVEMCIDCGLLNTAGRWHDTICSNDEGAMRVKQFVCEKEPQ